jgi:uncharacterized protein YjbJ (UPF0337 family)
MNKNQMTGIWQKTKGKLKEEVGHALGKPKLEASGINDQLKGSINEKVGKAKSVLEDAASAAADKVKSVFLLVVSLGAVSGSIANAVGNSQMEGDAGSRSSVSIGVQGGLSFANASTPTEISSSTRTGFLGGLTLQVHMTPFLAVQPELMYVQRGAGLMSGAGAKLSAETDSIELPVLLRVSLGERLRPYFFAGPVAIFNVSNRLVAAAGDNTGGISYNPRSFDLAADIGAGIEFENFFFNLRYSAGLLQDNPAQGSWQSRGFQLLVGANLGV